MADDDSELRAKIARLERRLDRENRARQEAERIAEAGLRSLYDANQELDQRILERTAELHQALQIAEAANNAKSAFLGQMSHQINTPLNGLLGMLELLANEIADAQAVEWHGSATRSARRLERLTTRLITYVELESADLVAKAQPTHLRAVLSAIHDRWHTQCLRAGQLMSVELEPGTDVEIFGADEVDLLFDELLSNVVEHAGAGAVTVVGRADTTSGRAIIDILDPGPGIEPALIERPHELNAVPDQTRQRDAKVNLGFALVDRIIRGFGGEWSALDDGRAGVTVSLPIVG